MPALSQEGDWSFLCVRGVDSASFYDTTVDIWNCSGNVACFVVHVITCGRVVGVLTVTRSTQPIKPIGTL